MFNFDNRVLYIILIIFIVFSITKNITDQNFLLNLILTLPAMLIAITFH